MYLYSFFNLGANGVGGHRHAPAPLPPGKTRCYCRGVWVGPRTGPNKCGKSRPAGVRSSDRPAHSELLYRLRYPGSRVQSNINPNVNECPDATKSRRMAECRLKGINNLRHVHVPINSETREKFLREKEKSVVKEPTFGSSIIRLAVCAINLICLLLPEEPPFTQTR